MHHIQKSLLLELSRSDYLRFSELKPEGIDNKLFDYHLKQLIRDKLVEKNTEGQYTLTTVGKQAIKELNSEKDVKAQSVLFLAVRNGNSGPWLLYKRLVHPLKDRIGFMHASPKPGLSIIQAAQLELEKKTGLRATFELAGSGFFEMYNSQDNLESYTHFVLLKTDTVSGELLQKHDRAEYFWMDQPNFSAPEMLPNMQILADNLQNSPFFIEKSFRLDEH